MTHPPGSVILPCQEQARYHLFTLDLRQLQLPQGSGLVFGMGTSIVQNLNNAIDLIPDSSEWIWLIGDDHRFPPDTVMNLLDHDLDIVACLCVRRQPPFQLVHYSDTLPGYTDEKPLYKVIPIDEIPTDGEPFPVVATGTTGMLIRRHVLETLGKPLFASTTGTAQNEELEFCRKAREAGFEVHVDPSNVLGHIGTMTYTPRLKGGEWGLELSFGSEDVKSFMPGGLTIEDLVTAV